MKLSDKRSIIIFTIICIVMFAAIYVYGESKENQSQDEEYQGIIRFHVIANSDSEEDQKLKLKVRDGVLEAINQGLVKQTMLQHQDAAPVGASAITSMNLEQSRKYIEENLDVICNVAEDIIKREGYKYEATAELGIRWIPKKTYGEVTFPAGNYEALNIVIGEGQGENWWCVLFPPLCIIDPDGSTLEQVETNIKGVTGPAITLKFKSVELVEKYF